MSINVLDSERVAGFAALLHQQAVREKGTEAANEEVSRWKESDARLEQRRRRENRAGWYSHYSRLAAVFRQRAEEFEAKAENLCRE
jgi:hypothetical protein